MVEAKSYWVYVLLCENDSYYTGYTTDLAQRFAAHCNGTAKCKYTRSFKPLKIAQSWEIKSGKADALRIERFIKALKREDKIKLIIQPELLFDLI